jgi:hypothetical protein
MWRESKGFLSYGGACGYCFTTFFMWVLAAA